MVIFLICTRCDVDSNDAPVVSRLLLLVLTCFGVPGVRKITGLWCDIYWYTWTLLRLRFVVNDRRVDLRWMCWCGENASYCFINKYIRSRKFFCELNKNKRVMKYDFWVVLLRVYVRNMVSHVATRSGPYFSGGRILN